MLDHVVTYNIKKNKDKLNYSIYNDPAFDTNSSNLSRGTRYPLPVVTVTLRGGKKRRATAVAGISCVRDSGATNIMIERNHNK